MRDEPTNNPYGKRSMAPTQESLDDKPEQAALCMGDAPPRAQPLGQHRRQHGAAVLAALGPLDERRHALAVDVAHLQRDHLAHAQARTVGNRQRGLVLQVVHGGDQPLELIGWLAIDGQERDFVDGGFAGAWGRSRVTTRSLYGYLRCLHRSRGPRRSARVRRNPCAYQESVRPPRGWRFPGDFPRGFPFSFAGSGGCRARGSSSRACR